MPSDPLPYIRFHPRDFYCDPQFLTLTTEQAGACIRLYCMAWLSDPRGTLPADDEALAQLAGVNGLGWQQMKTKVLAPYKLVDGRWHHAKLVAEASSIAAYRDEQKTRGKAGAEARWGSKNATAMPESWPENGTRHPPANAQAMAPRSPSPSPEKYSARAQSSPLGQKKPEGIDDATWEGIQIAERTKQRNAEAIARQNGARP